MRKAKGLLAVGVVVVLAGWLFVALSSGDANTPRPAGTVSQSPIVVQDVDAGRSGLPAIALDQLPSEAQQTYEIVLQGGPFEYPQDGDVFGNREGLLPEQDYGWYREYTVVTPASGDRGARRLVVGEDGVFFYTDDHYDSFREVIP
ncbi:MAG: ribonuclease domain-containing protein [Candidatus Nanopelagicales bacterium]